MSLTSFLTTSGATFAGSTSSNMSTMSWRASFSWSDLYGRYIIDRESPYTANEKPRPSSAVVTFSSAGAFLAHPADRSAAMVPTTTTQDDISFFVLTAPPSFACRALGASSKARVYITLGVEVHPQTRNV